MTQPQLVPNEEVTSAVAPPKGFVQAQAELELREIERRRQLYRGGRPMLDIAGRAVIVGDDGIATGGIGRPPPMRRTRRRRRVDLDAFRTDADAGSKA